MKLASAKRAAAALGALPGAAGANPVVRMAAKYWWFSIPAGLALYGKFRSRYEKHGKLHEYFADTADVLGPVLTLVSVFELATRLQQQGKLDPPQAIPRPGPNDHVEVPTANEYKPKPMEDMS